MKKYDAVEHPEHYNEGMIEVIEAMTALPIDEFRGYLKGNAIKYVFRAGHKQDDNKDRTRKAKEDLDKAIWYINKLKKYI